MKTRVVVVVLLLSVQVAVADAPPDLTEVQRLQVAAVLQRREIMRLRLEIAQTEFDRAHQDAQEMVLRLQRPGYRLDLQKLVYVPVPMNEESQGGNAKD